MSLLREKIGKKRLKEFFLDSYWYHTFELGDGIVTNGTFDLRNTVEAHRFPDLLAGKSVLDVGASDGFYSFELEKRNPESVLSVDTNKYDGVVPIDTSTRMTQTFIDKYSREKKEFEKYKDIYSLIGLEGANKLVMLADYFDSRVKFKNNSVYELEKMNQVFDVVFCGAVIEHLKDPLRALDQLRKVTKEMCIITLPNSVKISRTKPDRFSIKLAHFLIRILRLDDEFSVNSRDRIVKYTGNITGGSFFNIHPNTFREMLLAAGFKDAKMVGEFDATNNRYGSNNHYVVFHCSV